MNRRCTCGRSFAAHSMPEAARLLGVSRRTIQTRVAEFQIGQLVDGRWHFTEADLAFPINVPSHAACECGSGYAAHSLEQAARLVGLTRGAMLYRIKAERIGRLIDGRWHFRLDEIRPRQVAGRPRQDAVRARKPIGRPRKEAA